MSIRLEQRAGMLLVAGAALSAAAALAILPGVAEAQEHVATVPTTTVAEGADVLGPTNASADAPAPAAGPPPSRPDLQPDVPARPSPQPSRPASEPAARSVVVVEPGDSLWSISEKRLHPNANPQQVMSELERIFESNRDRIGDAPDLILPGQELLLPPPAVTEEPAAAAPAAPAVSEPAAAAPVSEPVALPDLPTVETVPLVRVSVEPSPEPYYASPRRLLGLGIMALSLAAAILMVWKLPMKRDASWAFATWGRSARPPTPSPRHQRSTGVLSDERSPPPPQAKTQRLRAVDGNLEPTTRLESPEDPRKEVDSDAV